MFRFEEKKTFKTVVICDGCGKETIISEGMPFIPNFDSRLNGSISKGYALVQKFGTFYNYCQGCVDNGKI